MTEQEQEDFVLKIANNIDNRIKWVFDTSKETQLLYNISYNKESGRDVAILLGSLEHNDRIFMAYDILAGNLTSEVVKHSCIKISNELNKKIIKS